MRGCRTAKRPSGGLGDGEGDQSDGPRPSAGAALPAANGRGVGTGVTAEPLLAPPVPALLGVTGPTLHESRG